MQNIIIKSLLFLLFYFNYLNKNLILHYLNKYYYYHNYKIFDNLYYEKLKLIALYNSYK
jgi:hypothetical protein